MKRMQQLQPKMLKIREKFKDKKQKLNAEMMGLYRKNKVNPLGGCLPILLQLPIFFSLYSALSTAVELRHEPFFAWIVDLSVPDGLGITPILMGISMYLIQKMTYWNDGSNPGENHEYVANHLHGFYFHLSYWIDPLLVDKQHLVRWTTICDQSHKTP
jgi:YidC/Oxa1 family membrane protein insertase